jgi:glycosyltransferase involved in cell wall biosynthesis
MNILSNGQPAHLRAGGGHATGGLSSFADFFVRSMVATGHRWSFVAKKRDPLVQQIGVDRLKVGVGEVDSWVVSVPRMYLRGSLIRAEVVQAPEIALAALIDAYTTVVREAAPDLVFINGAYTVPWVLLRAAQACGVPVVIQHAGIWQVERSLYAEVFSDAGRQMADEIELQLARLPEHHVFLNQYSQDAFGRLVEPVVGERASIISLPVSGLDAITQQVSGRPRRDPSMVRLGMVARWDRVKNHAAALDLVMAAKSAGVSLELASITSIPDTGKNKALKDAYRAHVKIEPPRSKADLLAWYATRDAMILPSVFDVSPHVVLEAATVGVPTFISPGVGYAETFREYGAGEFVVDFSDGGRALTQITELIGRPYPPALLDALREEHDPTRVIGQYLQLFSEVAGGVGKTVTSA